MNLYESIKSELNESPSKALGKGLTDLANNGDELNNETVDKLFGNSKQDNSNTDPVKEEVLKLIKDEQEAIDGYEKSKQTLLEYNISSDEYDKITKVYDHIITEEEEHIKELKELIGGEN